MAHGIEVIGWGLADVEFGVGLRLWFFGGSDRRLVTRHVSVLRSSRTIRVALGTGLGCYREASLFFGPELNRGTRAPKLWSHRGTCMSESPVNCRKRLRVSHYASD